MHISSDTRRALTRQYKDSVRPAGVFVVRNTSSQRVYVAGSLDVEGAMNRARFELNLRSHRNKALQHDWLAQGPAHFCIEVIDRVKERPDDPAFDRADELQKLLALWQEELKCFGAQGYNKP
ncbi:GIY-YIG nuclease family protein [Variovorax sp. H27-G14]|uniref:GIY-YIG nuclease family protein n=1 Tax=Variovorax sp. H27-G14 TaxID=3111914 RepID=UPI0038FC867B